MFCLTVTGRSMEPVLVAGDVIVARQQRVAENGSIVIVNLPGPGDVRQLAVKRLQRKGGKVVFRSLNPAFEDIVPPGDATIAGLVVGLYRRL